MCSYNKIAVDGNIFGNSTQWSCENPDTLRRDLKERIGQVKPLLGHYLNHSKTVVKLDRPRVLAVFSSLLPRILLQGKTNFWVMSDWGAQHRGAPGGLGQGGLDQVRTLQPAHSTTPETRAV